MYAVIKAGGHQYRVSQGRSLVIDKVAGDVGSKLVFDQVMMLRGEGDELHYGAPYISGASVEAEIKEQVRLPKVTIFKFKRRKGYKRRRGHRQDATVIEIKGINGAN